MSKNINKQASWGGRFEKALDPAIAKFQASITFDHRLCPYDIQGSLIHVAMLAKQKLISQAEMRCITEGLNAILQDYQAGNLVFKIEHEDIHMNIEQHLKERIGEVADKLHTGRSRNDQVALDLRLYLRKQIDHIDNLLSFLIETLNELMEMAGNTWLPGYTHLQRAQPIKLSQYWQAYLHMCQRDQQRFKEARKRMNFSPLGAGALAGSNLGLDRLWVASMLDFEGIVENTLDAVSDRDFIIEFCSYASLLMMHLSRLCEDIILFSSAEFNFIELDDAFATGSSLMPNKRNPDVAELIRAKTGRVYGSVFTLLTVMKALPLTYNKDLQEDKEALFDCVDTITAVLSILPSFLKSLKFNTDTMQQAIKESHMDATFFVEKLVLTGVPFRQAHKIVGQWVANAIKENKTLDEIAKIHMPL